MATPDQLAAYALHPEESVARLRAERRRIGLIYGVLAGLLYALAAWGFDGFRLAASHGFWPWLEFLVGLVPALAAGGLAGWLSARSEKAITGIALWAVAGAILAWIAGRLPYFVHGPVLRVLDPHVASLVRLSFGEGSQTRAGIALVACTVAFIFAGLLFVLAVDAHRSAVAPLAGWLPFLLAGVLFVVGGIVCNLLVSAPLTAPVATTDGLLQFVLDHRGETIDPQRSRALHLSSFDPLQDLLSRPRRLLVASNDSTVEQVSVLIDFDGVWARCLVMYDQLGYCERLASQ